MLFKVSSKTDIFKLNPELSSIPEFEKLTPRQMTYVVLATDYKSPFRKLTAEDRRTKAALTAGYKYEKDGKSLDMNARNLINGKTGSVEAAIKKYKSLQKDEDYETLLSVSNLIKQVRDLNNRDNMSVTELEKAVKLSLSLDKLVETKKKIEELLDMREDEAPEGVLTTEEQDVDMDNLPLLSLENEGLA